MSKKPETVNAETVNAETVNAETVNAETVNAETVNAETVKFTLADVLPLALATFGRADDLDTLTTELEEVKTLPDKFQSAVTTDILKRSGLSVRQLTAAALWQYPTATDTEVAEALKSSEDGIRAYTPTLRLALKCAGKLADKK